MDKLYNQRAWFKKRRGAVLTCPECGHTGAKVLEVAHHRTVPSQAVQNTEFYVLYCECEQCGNKYEAKLT